MNLLFRYIDEDGAEFRIVLRDDVTPLILCKEEDNLAMVYLPTDTEKINELIQLLESYKQTLEPAQ